MVAALGADTPGEVRFIAGVVRFVRAVSILIGVLVLGFPALDAAGVEMPVGLDSGRARPLVDLDSGARIAVIVILAAVTVPHRRGAVLPRRAGAGDRRRSAALERRKRTQTVAGLVRRFFSILIWIDGHA